MRVAKSIVVAVAGLGALLASLLFGMYATLVCTPYLGAPAGLLMIFVPIAMVFIVVATLKRLGWASRAMLGALLIACSLLLMPRPMCGAEPRQQHGC